MEVFIVCILSYFLAVLIYFFLTVKAANLILYLGVVRLFHLLRKGNQVLFIIW